MNYYMAYLKIHFNGCRDASSTKLLELFSKVFDCVCVRGDLYTSEILCESVYLPSLVKYKEWKYAFLISDTTGRVNDFSDFYDSILNIGEMLQGEFSDDATENIRNNLVQSKNEKTASLTTKSSIFDHIDAIFYINLASRPDRREHFLAEIAKLTNDMSRVHLIDAVAVKTNGALGCTLSHIKTFELIEAHPEWEKCIVFEDDFTFRYQTIKENTRLLCDFFENPLFKDWDLVNLSFNPGRVAWYDTVDPNVKRVHYTQTTSGYCISRDFVPKLKENFLQSAENMSLNGNTQINCCDINWNQLAPVSQWYLITPAVGYQYNNFSDIEQRVTTYGC